MQSLALNGFGLDQIWAQIEHHTSSVNDKLINQLTTLMADEDFLRNIASTDVDSYDEDDDEEASEGEGEDGIEAEYGDEDDSQKPDYKFEKDGGEESDGLHIDEKDGGIFDKNEDDSEVEEFMEGLENDEMDLDGLKLPSDAEEDDLDDGTDEPGLDDYDDESDFSKGIKDDFEDGDGAGQDKKAAADEDDEEDGEAEIDNVFAQANDHAEMDLVENLRQ